MRYHYFETIRDQLGNAVASASVYVYESGSETDLTIYAANSGGSSLGASPQLTTDADGEFEFWVDDDDYDQDQKIKTVITKTGFTTKTIDYIDIFPNLGDHAMMKDASGDKWYSRPNDDDGGWEASTTKGDIT